MINQSPTNICKSAPFWSELVVVLWCPIETVAVRQLNLHLDSDVQNQYAWCASCIMCLTAYQCIHNIFAIAGNRRISYSTVWAITYIVPLVDLPSYGTPTIKSTRDYNLWQDQVVTVLAPPSRSQVTSDGLWANQRVGWGCGDVWVHFWSWLL